MGFPDIDHGTLYRELRRLEKDGFVSSEWETGDSGPAGAYTASPTPARKCCEAGPKSFPATSA